MKIFLSAVSGEFKSCRDALASDLRAVGAEVVVQKDFQQHGRTLLEKLENYIAGCDRVIALAGQAYGGETDGAALPGKARRSFTQWEYFFAQGERLDGPHRRAKDTFVYFASPDFLQKNPVSQRPTPPRFNSSSSRAFAPAGRTTALSARSMNFASTCCAMASISRTARPAARLSPN